MALRLAAASRFKNGSRCRPLPLSRRRNLARAFVRVSPDPAAGKICSVGLHATL
jgi:hypothetical protein